MWRVTPTDDVNNVWYAKGTDFSVVGSDRPQSLQRAGKVRGVKDLLFVGEGMRTTGLSRAGWCLVWELLRSFD